MGLSDSRPPRRSALSGLAAACLAGVMMTAPADTAAHAPQAQTVASDALFAADGFAGEAASLVLSGRAGDALPILDRALDLTNGVEGARAGWLEAELRRWRGAALRGLRRFEEARADLDRARRYFDANGYDDRLGYTLKELGLLVYDQGKSDEL